MYLPRRLNLVNALREQLQQEEAAEGSTLCQLLQLELFGQMFEEAKGKQGLWEWRGEGAVCAQVTQRNALVLLPVMNPNESRDST